MLSENSRTSVTTLSKRLKCARNTIKNNINALEKEFDIKYTLQFSTEALGLSQKQIWSIKFRNKPKIDEIKKIFENDSSIQFAAITNGDFDLLLIRITPTNLVGHNDKYVHWGLNAGIKLAPYKPIFKSSTVVTLNIGFTPLQSETIEKLDLKQLGIDDIDKKIILLLNSNSKITYRAAAKKLMINVETFRYRLRKILNKHIITRFTIVARKVPMKYSVAFFMNYEITPGIKERRNLAYQYYIEQDGILPLFNQMQYIALLNGSYLLFCIGCFENEENGLRDGIVAHKNLYKEDNPNISYAKITNIIKGNIPIRNIDIAKDYKPIIWK